MRDMNFSRALSLSFLLAFLGACGGSSGPAAQPPAAWSEPTQVLALEAPGPGYNFVVQAVQPDAAGGLTVKWDQPSGLPGFVHRQPSGSWTQVPSIPADTGSTYGAWTTGASGVGSVLIAPGVNVATTLTAIRFAAGAWSAPASVPSSAPLHLSLALDAIYDAQRRLAYSPLATNDGLLPGVTRYDPAAGGWQPVELLAALPGTTQVYMGPGAIAADGRMIATWAEQVNGEFKAVYYTFRPGTGWSEPAVLPGVDTSSPYRFFAGVDGNFLVSHSRRTTHLDERLLSRFHPDTGWESPVVVASTLAEVADASIYPAAMHQGEGGHILATWEQSKHLVPGGGIVWEPWSRFFDPATGWTPPVRAPQITTRRGEVGNGVRVDPSGKVVVASPSGISTLDGNGNWVTVDPPPNQSINGSPSFAIEASGAITAIWRESVNNRITFMASTYR